tara:strand:+ start:2546 stop:3211 length:666 start_codon:yes stop_codon:yes gene_type:complete
MTVLVVAPHPDDEVLGCGGVMARHVGAGEDVYVTVVGRGIPELFSDESVARSRAELADAHRVLGVRECRFLDFPVPRLDTVPGHELADAIGRLIAEWQPTTLYLPHHGDIHSDHFHVHNAGLVAARPLAGCPVRRVLAYETLSETEWARPTPDTAFQPTVFIDISHTLEKKIESMACYQSKLVPPPHPRSLETIRSLASLRGSTVHLGAAEAFVLVREIDL